MSMSGSKGRGEQAEVEDKVYVAVGKKVKESKSTLVWALQNSGGREICILHVHQPAQMIPSPIGYFPAESVGKEEVNAHREKERKQMSKIFDEYSQLCLKAGVHVDKVHIETKSIEEGILQLINQHKISRLVMGAAADKKHTRTMTELRSKKAIYIREHAPPFCHIWFVCKGYLIHKRAAVQSPSPDGDENRLVNCEGNGGEKGLINYEANEGASPTAPPVNIHDWSPPRFSADSDDSPFVSRSVSGRVSGAGWLGYRYQPSPGYPSPAHWSELGTVPETLYLEECRRSKETEAELAKVKEELSYMKNHVLGELRSALEQKTLLENQLGNSTFLLKMLGEKLASTVKLADNLGGY